MSPFMPRDHDKNNDSRGRRDRPGGGRGRSGVPRGPEKKFAKRGFGRKTDGEGERRPYAGKRDDRPSRIAEGEKRSFRPRDDGDKRPYAPRGERPDRYRGDRKSDAGDRKRDPGDRRRDAGDRGDARPAGRFQDRKFGDRPFKARSRDGDRPERNFGGDRKFSRDRGPRQDFRGRSDRGDEFGRDRGDEKPWQKREPRGRDAARNFDRPKFERPRYDKPRDRDGDDRPPFSRQREDRSERSGFDRPRERPKFDRPRRDNEDDSKIFAKRPAFGGRGAYRDRKPDFDKRAPREAPQPKKSGERIAKVLARAGLASRRDAEAMVTQGRVAVNGRIINSPALDVTTNDVVTVDGAPLPPRERTRLFLYHKPRGLMTTHADPEGRPTVFDNLPEGLPRLISVGRLDFNTEGLLLLTNDGGLARALELPDTGWLRRYRVRAHGDVTQEQLDALKNGIEVDGVKYGSIEATLERDQGANVWLVFAIREGKNREVRNVMAYLGLEVNRLIRVSYGPFQLAELAEGAVEEVKTRVLREQLGEKVAALAGADFGVPAHATSMKEDADAPRGKKPFKPAGKSALIADSKGRRVLVRRTGSDEARARNEEEANGYGPPRRPKRGYHGKRDLKPRDE
jgi:23S rRNA pseudouridine2605 synthase